MSRAGGLKPPTIYRLDSLLSQHGVTLWNQDRGACYLLLFRQEVGDMGIGCLARDPKLCPSYSIIFFSRLRN